MYFPSRPPPPVLGSPCSAVMAEADADEEMCPVFSLFQVPSSNAQTGRLEPMEVGGQGLGGILLHADFPRVVI